MTLQIHAVDASTLRQAPVQGEARDLSDLACDCGENRNTQLGGPFRLSHMQPESLSYEASIIVLR